MIDEIHNGATSTVDIQTKELKSVLPASLERKEKTRERDELLSRTREMLLKLRAEAVIRPQNAVTWAERLNEGLIYDDMFVEQVADLNERMSQDMEVEDILFDPNADKRLLTVLLRHSYDLYIKSVELKVTLKGGYQDAVVPARNQRYAEEILPHHVEEATTTHRYIARVMIDLDRFKQVNDELGHEMGNEVLRAVTRGIQSRLRESDLFARSGGDEFTVVLFDVTQEETEKIARDIQEAVAQETRAIGLRLNATEKYPAADHLTLSIGMSLNQGQHIPDDDLKEQSDKATYAVKRAGRNNISVYDQATMASINTKEPIPR